MNNETGRPAVPSPEPRDSLIGRSRGRPAIVGREMNTYYGRAIVQARPTFHLTYRLGIRSAQFVSLGGAAAPGAGIWRAALPLFVVADMVVYCVLRRTEKFGLLLRLACDTLDIAFWSLSPRPVSGDFGIAVQVGVPLAVESGFRIGSWAFVVPATEIAATVAVRMIAGRSLSALPFSPLLIGVAMGIALFAYCGRLYRHSEVERKLRLSADRRRAFLAGQNAVAMGASSVVDVIEGLVPVLGRPRPGSALWQLADGWKARRGDSTAREATYLQVALLEWARAHNRHPDLASQVDIFLDEGAGTTLLTGPQVGGLRQSLDQLGLRGRIHVAPTRADCHLRTPGASLSLRVGTHQVIVPPDAKTSLRPLDGSVVGYLMVATFIPLMTPSSAAGLPWGAAATGISLSLGAGWWAHRRLRAYGVAARGTNLHCAVLTSLALTALLSFTIGRTRSINGDANLAAAGLPLLALVGGAYWRASRSFLAEFVSGVIATCLLSIVLFRGAVTARGILMMAMWGLFLYFPVWQRIGLSLDRAQDQHARDAAAADADAVTDAFREGQQEVIALVCRARDEAQRQLGALTTRLPAANVDLANSRLAEVDIRLAVIGVPEG